MKPIRWTSLSRNRHHPPGVRPDALTMIERIGGTFVRGNPFIIQVAWRILLNGESKSMRACARKIGCTPQAISKRVRLLAEHFGYPISDRRLREMRRDGGKAIMGRTKAAGGQMPARRQ